MICLIRHGETPGNATRVIQLPEAPLSQRGLEQARLLGASLTQAGIAAVLSSDYARARATAEALCEATGAPLALEPLLRERHLGELRGRPYAELGFDPFAPGYAPPGGETWERFHARVDRAWQRVLEAAAGPRGHLAVVTHGLVCLSLASRHLALPEGVDLGRGVANTGVCWLDPAPPYRVERFNCTRHLEDGGPGGPGEGWTA